MLNLPNISKTLRPTISDGNVQDNYRSLLLNMQIPETPPWSFCQGRFGLCTFRTTTRHASGPRVEGTLDSSKRNKEWRRSQSPLPWLTRKLSLRQKLYDRSNDELDGQSYSCLRNMESSIKHVSHLHNLQMKFHCFEASNSLKTLYLPQCTYVCIGFCVNVSRNVFLWLVFKSTNTKQLISILFSPFAYLPTVYTPADEALFVVGNWFISLGVHWWVGSSITTSKWIAGHKIK